MGHDFRRLVQHGLRHSVSIMTLITKCIRLTKAVLPARMRITIRIIIGYAR